MAGKVKSGASRRKVPPPSNGQTPDEQAAEILAARASRGLVIGEVTEGAEVVDADSAPSSRFSNMTVDQMVATINEKIEGSMVEIHDMLHAARAECKARKIDFYAEVMPRLGVGKDRVKQMMQAPHKQLERRQKNAERQRVTRVTQRRTEAQTEMVPAPEAPEWDAGTLITMARGCTGSAKHILAHLDRCELTDEVKSEFKTACDAWAALMEHLP